MTVTTVLLSPASSAIFAGIFLSLTAVGVFTNEARGVSKSLAVVEAFSAAPQALKDEMDPGFQDRVLDPFIDRFAALGRRLTPSDYSERILAKLNVAGNPPGWTVDRVLRSRSSASASALVARRAVRGAARQGARLHGRRRASLGVAGRLLRPEPVPLPEGLRPDGEDGAGAARTLWTC